MNRDARAYDSEIPGFQDRRTNFRVTRPRFARDETQSERSEAILISRADKEARLATGRGAFSWFFVSLLSGKLYFPPRKYNREGDP